MLVIIIAIVLTIGLSACSERSDDTDIEYCKHDDPMQIEIVEAVAPTCQKPGITSGIRCNLCGIMIMPQISVGETIECCEGEWIIDREATKTEDGAKHTECTMCGKIMSEDIIVLGSQHLAYTINSAKTACIVTGVGNCMDLDILIPSEIDGYIVTSIGEGAFERRTSRNSVTILNSIQSIGDYAFIYCNGLTYVVIGKSVESIGDQAFYSCTSLTSIIFEGTIEQWNAILKGEDWDGNTGNYIIYCADGQVAKEGTITYK